MGATTLTISVSGINDVMLSFNTIRIKRSITGIDGTYSLLTGNAPAAATMLAPNTGTYAVAGKTLSLKFDQEAQVNVLFLGLAPLTTQQVVDRINEVVGHTVASDDNNKLRLTSILTGTVSKIVIVGGSANPVFGWQDGQWGLGLDAHVTLQTDVSAYNYVDHDGQAGYYYRAQFYNTSNGLESTDSDPFEGDVGTLVPADKLCTIKVDLVDARGIAVPGQEITFYPQHELLTVAAYQVALNRAPTTIVTNNAGHAEVTLVRGLHVRVVFEGTSIIRDITIPDASTANLLTEMSAVPDPFDIKKIPFPTAPRRTI